MEKTTERGALCSVLLTRYYSGDQIETTEMDRACNTYGDEERCIQRFGRETWTTDYLEDLSVEGRIKLK